MATNSAPSAERKPKVFELEGEDFNIKQQLTTKVLAAHNLVLGKDVLHGDVINCGNRFSCAWIACRADLVSKEEKKVVDDGIEKVTESEGNEDKAENKSGDAKSENKSDDAKADETKVNNGEAEAKSEIVLIRNRDDSGSGYLTIPECVTIGSGIRNVMETFADMSKKVSLMNLFFDGNDEYVRNRFNDWEKIPSESKFEIWLTDGEEETYSVFGNNRRVLRITDRTSVRDIIAKLTAEELSRFKVEVFLDPEDKKKWYTTHGEGHESGSRKEMYAARVAYPSMCPGWEQERHAPGGGNGETWRFEWSFSGPSDFHEEMKDQVMDFLADYKEKNVKMVDKVEPDAKRHHAS